MRVPMIFAALLAAPVCAQFPTGPAKQIADFDKFLGVFEGSGTSRETPDSPEIQWRATCTFEKVLGGHFVRENVVVDFSPAMPTPMLMERYYGYDGQNQKLVAYEISNFGRIQPFDLGWDGGELVMTTQSLENGKPHVSRTIMDVVDDTLVFRAEHAMGAGEWFTHVSGEMPRVKVAEASTKKQPDQAFVMHVDLAQVEKLSFMHGEWHMTGTIVMAPGQEPMEIGGTEWVKPIWGGTVLSSKVLGDPMDGMVYESRSYIAWNGTKKCYDVLAVENFGQIWSAEAYLTDDGNFVMIGSGKMHGIPTAGRSVLEVEDGKMTRIFSDTFFAASPSIRSFDGTYEKLK